MAFDHKPLEEHELGAAAKMVGAAAPPPMKLMVARGMAPLPPRDLLIGLYHLWVLNEQPAADAAGKTIADLPDAVIEGGLGDRDLAPGVLDLLGRKLVRREALLDRLVRHPNVDDQTLIGVARVCPERVCDTLAENQQRWIRCPEIVASLFQNRHCRMSVVRRMLEFAEREDIDVRMPGIEELRVAMKEEGEVDETELAARDAIFRQAVGGTDATDALAGQFAKADAETSVEALLEAPEAGADEDDTAETTDAPSAAEAGAAAPAGEEPPEEQKKLSRTQQILLMGPTEKIRAALLGDKTDRGMLIRDSNRMVAMAAIKSPRVNDAEAVAYSSNRALHPDVIRYIANKREWVKLYTVKVNLVFNPKTPLNRAMSLLSHLNKADVRRVARSKNIPTALAKAAQRKMATVR
jgi:hypothetical protein